MPSSQSFLDQLPDHLLWDVDRATIDADRHARFLISRIMDRGSRADVNAAWGYYGEDRIREALLDTPSLDSRTIAFFANQFQLPREDFRAYRKASATWTQ